MTGKCALIVDDSRLAREVLSQMLERHELRVETAESAEDALAYLGAHRPDVIFMDHLMPGMDGFEAVKAIKQNPVTATIPVMMYTSQSGELYVGQARALGAVGVLPKQIKPVEVAEVLRSLHLIDAENAAMLRPPGDSRTLPGAEVAMEPADWSDLHRWLQEMLNDHGRNLRTDLEASVSRILGEHLGSVPPNPGAAAGSRRPAFWPYGALMAVLAIVATVFFWLHLDAQNRWQAATRQNLGLMAALESQRASEATQALTTAATASRAGRDTVAPSMLLQTLEWSMNQSATFGADEIPFGDARAQSVISLVEQLRQIGFRGTVLLEGHLGDFCVMRGADGGFQPAADDLPVTRCDRVSLAPEEATALSARQSVTFANYVADVEAAGGDIRVEVRPFGNAEPREPYPAAGAGTTAGDWNRAARANQRVEVRLLAATDPAMP